MLAARRRARYGSLLALPVVRLWAAKRTPSESAACLCCSRARVDRLVTADRPGPLGLAPAADGPRGPPGRTTVLPPSLQRSRRALRKAAPRASGWCRTRWRWAPLAVTWPAKRGRTVAAETGRRWGHAGGWGWQRAKRVAQDNDPQRGARLARLRWVCEPLQAWELLGCAAALAMPWRPKGGDAWRPTGGQGAVRTPGQHEQPSLAGALAVVPGRLLHCRGARTPTALCRDRLSGRATTYPPTQSQRLSVGRENDNMHPAKAVAQGLARPPRFPWWFFPPYCPRATPMARALGDVHDQGTRPHTRKR
jgi:hypothetical protein